MHFFVRCYQKICEIIKVYLSQRIDQRYPYFPLTVYVLYRQLSNLAFCCLPQTQNNVVKYYVLQFPCKI
jgi:hypothetical protein